MTKRVSGTSGIMAIGNQIQIPGQISADRIVLTVAEITGVTLIAKKVIADPMTEFGTIVETQIAATSDMRTAADTGVRVMRFAGAEMTTGSLMASGVRSGRRGSSRQKAVRRRPSSSR
jgi:hypothetical protein